MYDVWKDEDEGDGEVEGKLVDLFLFCISAFVVLCSYSAAVCNGSSGEIRVKQTLRAFISAVN
jgi:hypothetical protein